VSILTVDCGNSTLDCIDHASGRRVRLESHADPARELSALCGAQMPERCCAVSVVDGGLARLSAWLSARAIPLLVAGRDVPCPLPLDYATPNTLGADRWLGALAAHRLFGRAVTVDCGSATTVNLVEADGTFRGGGIAPGLRAFVTGLKVVTPALPAPDLDSTPQMPGRTSQGSVDVGVLSGYAGLVERLVADALRCGRGPAQVVVTGGQAGRLLSHTRLRAVHIDDLVHQGLLLLGA
jgi:type III pantothenate kinase